MFTACLAACVTLFWEKTHAAVSKGPRFDYVVPSRVIYGIDTLLAVKIIIIKNEVSAVKRLWSLCSRHFVTFISCRSGTEGYFHFQREKLPALDRNRKRESFGVGNLRK